MCPPVDMAGHVSPSTLDNPHGIFSFKGAQTGSAHRYRAEANTLASESPRKYSSKEYDVKITVTHKEKEQLRQKAVRSDSGVMI